MNKNPFITTFATENNNLLTEQPGWTQYFLGLLISLGNKLPIRKQLSFSKTYF